MEKYGGLNLDILKKNITKITYNETSFNSLYYGGLSHDDLLGFAKIIAEKFPKIKEKISKKYQLIFIDEYQDTSAEVLKIFYDSVKGTSSKLLFLGDRMQQTYKTYDGSFENEFSKMNHSDSFNINYRSSKIIIDLLNNIYNNKDFQQKEYEENEIKSDYNPRLIICDDFKKEVNTNIKEYPDSLILYLLNKNKFKKIGSINLYNTYNKIKRYSFGKKYSVLDALTDTSIDNPDEMMKILFLLNTANLYWQKKQYGNLISLCKKHKKLFN
ncbi:UvrD-helicase domain-containing protein [Clostridium tetani]|uniref:UvrD-helicase domain-containing protein n=1 Tax=Clostridium tetani TaxID=1513 RepID=UPI0029546215|nr:UvrD-helicase domain-containing protein [Clostridium tetani]